MRRLVNLVAIMMINCFLTTGCAPESDSSGAPQASERSGNRREVNPERQTLPEDSSNYGAGSGGR